MPRRQTLSAPPAPVALAAIAAGAFLTGRTILRRSRRIDLNYRTALVTGGSRGLGLILARELLHRGCRVAICARDQDELRRAEADLQQHGPAERIFATDCDLAKPAQINVLIEEIRSRFGPVDV